MDMWMDVDTALSEVPVNIMPLIDNADFKTIEDAVAYNAAGMDLRWNFVTTAGAFTSTAVTPTTGGAYDWTHQGDGIYTIEIPASGGASANNDTEGFGWFSGVVTGVLPFRGPVIGFRAAALNDALIDGGDNLDVNAVQWLGTACATPTVAGVPEVDLTHVAGSTTDVSTVIATIVALAAKFSGITLVRHWLGMIAGKQAADATALTEIRATGAGSGTYDPTTDSNEAIKDAAVDSDDLVDAICDEALSGHTTAGTVGYALGNLPSTVKKNTALSNFGFVMIDSSDDISGKTGVTVTAERSIDGGSFASCTNSASEISAGAYKINLSAADLNGDVIILKFTGTGCNATLLTLLTKP